MFLTTAEAADYLRLGERKLYELVANNAIPCSKVTGKWLFPKAELDRWVLAGLHKPDGMPTAEPPPIIGGSQDALLEWCQRESGSGLATLAEGTERGIQRLQQGEVIAAAIHVHRDDETEATQGEANVGTAQLTPGLHDAVLVGFVKREQGLLVPPGNPKNLRSLGDVLARGATMAVRQPGAGAQMLLDVLLKREGARAADLRRRSPPSLTGPDLAATVRSGAADCGIATRAAAKSGGLDFVPLTWEHFDLLMRQRSFFQPSMQALMRLLTSTRARDQAATLTGYDLATAGTVRFAT
ncbi:MAG: DNA-binding protein [Proteobacteria bacterium SG_bin9]|nr:MAG: DNA-binding protein [Proteobacteria bacterium SG_bin9]